MCADTTTRLIVIKHIAQHNTGMFTTVQIVKINMVIAMQITHCFGQIMQHNTGNTAQDVVTHKAMKTIQIIGNGIGAHRNTGNIAVIQIAEELEMILQKQTTLGYG